MALQRFINIAFDATSVHDMLQFSHFPAAMVAEVNAALQQGGTLVAQSVETNTWSAFQNPTGALAGSITSQLTGEMEDTITVDKPYANRLEFGFGPGGTPQADSLGRVYQNPPEPYANPGLEANVDQIMTLVSDAIMRAFLQTGTH